VSLSERLQRARTQQLIEAGLLTSEHALKPEQPDVPVDDSKADAAEGLFTPVSYEVPPMGLHLVAPGLETPADLGDLEAGDGSACPNCNGEARLDMVDLVGHTMHYTCENCSAMWQVRKPAPELA